MIFWLLNTFHSTPIHQTPALEQHFTPNIPRPTAAELLRHRLMTNLDPDSILGHLVARTKEAVRRLDNKNYRAARKIFMLNNHEGVSGRGGKWERAGVVRPSGAWGVIQESHHSSTNVVTLFSIRSKLSQ